MPSSASPLNGAEEGVQDQVTGEVLVHPARQAQVLLGDVLKEKVNALEQFNNVNTPQSALET